ncbi:MAG TPA: HAMP domain-containing sensor histidine kinase [Jatrophihabitantaceae bacterium]
MVEPAHPQRRLGLRSLTARLVIGVVALVIVLVTAIGTATYFALRSSLFDRLDQQLQSTANENLNQLFLGGPQSAPTVHGPQDVYAVALTGNGAAAYPSSPSVEDLHLSAADRKMLANRTSTKPITITTTDGRELRVTVRSAWAHPVGDPGDQFRATAVVGLSTAEEDRTLSQLLAFELIIGLAAVVVAFGATMYGVRYSLRNLRRVTTTANEVAAELSPTGAGLDRRVDVPDDGTEVGQLAESMNTLLAAVEMQFAARLHSEERLRQFVADASHELRTPLTSIRGYAELARMQKAAGANADDNLARIESEGTRMSRLVDDLLMLARGDQSRAPRLELIDVAELLDDAVNSARAAMPDRPIDVEHGPGLNVVGDRDQLYRVVSNLIGNANMHTAPGRPVLVRCYGARAEVVVQVIDGGPGLPPEEAAHVFERFWRADKARSRARGGTGLGLSIVAAIVAAHGGTVRFDSTVEQGSTVTVRLPAVDT